MANNPNEIKVTKMQTYTPEKPIDNDTDMVELLILVVDDICVQIGELKEQRGNDEI